MFIKKKKFSYKSIPINQLLKINSESNNIDISLTQKLNNELVQAYNKINLSDKEFEIRQIVFNKIKHAIESEIKNIKVEAYGSFKTKMMVFDSDIDITIINNSLSDDKIAVNQFLRKVENIIYKHNLSSGTILHIKSAKTPILKFVDIFYGIKIDISINQADGLKTADYILEQITKNKDIEYLVILLKYFLKKRSLSASANGGLCAYAQFLLILNFIQLHPLISSEQINIKNNIGILFIDFFQYYSKFPFDMAKIDVNAIKYTSNNISNINIVDPICTNDELRNVARSTLNMNHIVDVFKFSYKLMTAAINQKIDPRKCILDLWIRLSKEELNKRAEMCLL